MFAIFCRWNILWVEFSIGGIFYGVFIALKSKKERKKPVVVKPTIERPEVKAPEVIAADEISKLRTFAKEEELEDKAWIPLEKEIKKKPLTPKKFDDALERLRKIAHKERVKPEKPLLRLRAMLEELGEEEISDLIAGYKLLRAGLLTTKEKEMLFRKLKITAEYYRTHKEELEKELATYGKPKRKKKR